MSLIDKLETAKEMQVKLNKLIDDCDDKRRDYLLLLLGKLLKLEMESIYLERDLKYAIEDTEKELN